MAAGDDSSVALPSPTGNVDTRLTASGDHRQVVVLGNPGDRVVGVDARGALNVNEVPTHLLTDGWAGTSVDTTVRWTQVGNAPTVSNGSMTMPATLSSYNYLKTQFTLPYTLGHNYIAMGIQIEGASAGTGAGRFWGVGNQATTPAAAVLAQDGVGFELDQATGALLAVVYAGGSRTTIATLTRPTDGAIHRYAIHYRPTDVAWYVDGLDVPVATTTFPANQIGELPVLIVRQNAASLTNSPVFVNTAVAAGDTARTNLQLSDATYPSRRAQIGKSGGLSVKGASIAVATPLVVAAAGTGTMTAYDVSEAGNVTFTAYNTTAGSAWAGAPVLVFEQSYDGTSWGPLVVVRNDTGAAASTHVLGANTANAAIMFDAPAEAINYVRVRVTTGPTTNGMTIAASAGGMPFTPFVTTVDRKDAGRVPFTAYFTTAAGATSDTLASMTLQKGASGTSSVTTVPVTTGKTMRISSIQASVRATAATLPYAEGSLRINWSGAAVIGSPLFLPFRWSGSAAVIGNTGMMSWSGDGGLVELTGSAQFGVSYLSNLASNVLSFTVVGYEFSA